MQAEKVADIVIPQAARFEIRSGNLDESVESAYRSDT